MLSPSQVIVLATPVFFALIAVEWIISLRRGRNAYGLADAISSLNLGVLPSPEQVRIEEMVNYFPYAYPAPAGFEAAPVSPVAAHWDAGLGEFILPYAAVRAEDEPDAALCAFLETTYQAAADLAAWDREALECPRGAPRQPRWVG